MVFDSLQTSSSLFIQWVGLYIISPYSFQLQVLNLPDKLSTRAFLTSGVNCYSGGSGSILHLLGSVPLPASTRCLREEYGAAKPCSSPHLQRSHLRVRCSVLPVHHNQPSSLQYYVQQVQTGIQGMCLLSYIHLVLTLNSNTFQQLPNL